MGVLAAWVMVGVAVYVGFAVAYLDKRTASRKHLAADTPKVD